MIISVLRNITTFILLILYITIPVLGIIFLCTNIDLNSMMYNSIITLAILGGISAVVMSITEKE